MIKYLTDHFRYYTMHSWNRSTSYARDVKLHHLDLPKNIRNKAYEFLDIREAYLDIHALIAEFERKYDWQWQVGFNGRSSGYLVLYQGGRRKSDYHTRCDVCSTYTRYTTEQSCHVEGCEGTLLLLDEEPYEVYAYPGKGVDDETDFSDWYTEELIFRVELVRDFDWLCDACIKTYIHFVKTHSIEEKEILVPEKRRVAVRIKK